ncbi:hypothetical protein CMI47_19845 [Candidatus Pacearchaeota archaeon]|nr:hypothetical protein [Candidatus Pacearchaeota archaeon]
MPSITLKRSLDTIVSYGVPKWQLEVEVVTSVNAEKNIFILEGAKGVGVNGVWNWKFLRVAITKADYADIPVFTNAALASMSVSAATYTLFRTSTLDHEYLHDLGAGLQSFSTGYDVTGGGAGIFASYLEAKQCYDSITLAANSLLIPADVDTSDALTVGVYGAVPERVSGVKYSSYPTDTIRFRGLGGSGDYAFAVASANADPLLPETTVDSSTGKLFVGAPAVPHTVAPGGNLAGTLRVTVTDSVGGTATQDVPVYLPTAITDLTEVLNYE